MVQACETFDSDPEGSQAKLVEATDCEARFPAWASTFKFGTAMSREVAELAREILAPGMVTARGFQRVYHRFKPDPTAAAQDLADARKNLSEHEANPPTCSTDPDESKRTVDRYKLSLEHLKREVTWAEDRPQTHAKIVWCARELEETVRKLETLLERPSRTPPEQDTISGW